MKILNHREHREETQRTQREDLDRRNGIYAQDRRGFLFPYPFWLFPKYLCVLCVVSLCVLCGSKSSAQKKVKTGKTVVSPWDVEAREYLGTPQSEAAVKRGLDYLAVTQQSDGHWNSTYRNEVAITGLALMAYLASGYQPGRGKYGLTMNQAVDYLVNSARSDGSYGAVGFIRGAMNTSQPMYGHGFATLALSEVYGMTGRKEVKTKLEAAIKLIEDSQTQNGDPRYDGGWRYDPRQGDADLSVTVVQVLALRGAKNAGIKVAQETINRAVAYMKRCANNNDGGFNYQYGQHNSGPARTGAGVLSLMMAGERDSAECQNGLAYLQANPLNGTNDWPYRDHFFYGMYYVTQAMYQAGGAYWRSWYPTIRNRLIAMQDSDGGWARSNGYSEAGPEYATAMSVLVLQVPAGLLPIYQK